MENRIFFNLLREREPWGVGRFYVEAKDESGIVVFMTDLGGKGKVQQAAISIANERGLVYWVR